MKFTLHCVLIGLQACYYIHPSVIRWLPVRACRA